MDELRRKSRPANDNESFADTSNVTELQRGALATDSAPVLVEDCVYNAVGERVQQPHPLGPRLRWQPSEDVPAIPAAGTGRPNSSHVTRVCTTSTGALDDLATAYGGVSDVCRLSFTKRSFGFLGH